MYQISYEQHPAFVPLNITSAGLPWQVATLIAETDKSLALIDKESALSRLRSERQEVRALHRSLMREIARLPERLHVALLESRTDWTDWERDTLRRYVVFLDLEYARYLRHQARRLRRAAVRHPPQTFKPGGAMEALSTFGAVAFPLSPRVMARVRAAAGPYLAGMRRVSDSAPDSFHAKTIHIGHIRLWQAISAAVDEVGARNLASQYLGYHVGLSSVGLHIHEAGNAYFNRRYNDVGVETSQVAGMHFDTGSGSLKAMLYLSEVSADDGAFGYIEGTNRLAMPHSLRFSAQALPSAGIMLDSVDQRRFFMKLPIVLRQTSHFGGDYYDPRQEEEVLRKERRFTSRDGDFVLFDNAGLHRGGIRPRTERVALQLQFSSLTEKVMTRFYRLRKRM